jgi:integral membrane protein
MPIGPRIEDVPRVRLLLRIFRVSAIITGVLLLGLCAMMVLRYGFGVDIEVGGPFGFVALVPKKEITALDFSTLELITHGWLYVLYLGLDFLLWRMVRFSFGRFLWFALGGVIPFLSFYFEFRIPAYINGRIAETEARQAAVTATTAPASAEAAA